MQIVNKNSSYKQVFKATSLFGGAQLIIIIIGLIRSKIIAFFLGTVGFGLSSLLNAPIQIILTITGLGISFSAVRDISIAHGKQDLMQIRKVYSTFRYWMWITGILGIIITLILAPFLSSWSFGNSSYTLVFICLSVTILFTSFSNGQAAYLRGIRKLSSSAKASILGPLLGLIFSIPLYYLYGMSAIAPCIFLTAIVTLLSSWIFFRTVAPPKMKLSVKEIFHEGSGMIRLGIVMTVAGLLTQLVSYIIILFISKEGGVGEVGLYNAGWSITNQYVGIIFSAMAVDYFPRLAAVSDDNLKVKETVNEQGEITILLLAPALLLFIILMPLIVELLFTNDFINIIPFVRWVALGMILRAAAWVIAFVPGAKGDTKFFLILELIGGFVFCFVTILGYLYWGLEGAGIAFAINYLVYLAIVYYATHKRYQYSFNSGLIKILIVQLSVLIIETFIIKCNQYVCLLSSLMIVACFSYSFIELNTRLGLISIIKKYIWK